ncbi:MAG TPA: hypothetical protein VH063_19560 [Gaiellaceae bacterium]|jgi:hypothetical protein|nr:hypothetical protein [Gaiellaceae bacterium]
MAERRTPSTRIALVGLVALACLVVPACVQAKGIPNHHRMTALYVIDHRGRQPRGDADLVQYSRPFQRILTGCQINADALTNMAIELSDKASYLGDRNVTSLQILKSIAQRVPWRTRHYCQPIYDRAEAYREAGAS